MLRKHHFQDDERVRVVGANERAIQILSADEAALDDFELDRKTRGVVPPELASLSEDPGG